MRRLGLILFILPLLCRAADDKREPAQDLRGPAQIAVEAIGKANREVKNTAPNSSATPYQGNLVGSQGEKCIGFKCSTNPQKSSTGAQKSTAKPTK